MAREATNPVQTTERSLDVLETLRELDGATLTRIAEHVDLPNSTVHNHLSTLVERGFVVRDGDVYRLSLRFLEFGEHTRSQRSVFEIAKPELDELAAETGEVASLLVEENGQGVYLYTARGEKAVPLDTDPGTHVPLHATALGKCLLAQLSDDRVNEILDRNGMPSLTEHTITDREQLFSELSEIREAGVAYDEGEQHVGLRSVAAAIKDENGAVVGAIGISGPTSRLSDERISEEIPDLLLQSTNVIELTMAHS